MVVVDADVDAARVTALHETIVDAVHQHRTDTGLQLTPRLLLEALLVNIATVIRDAPSDEVRAAFTEHSIDAIMRNSGVTPAAILSVRLARRHDAAVQNRAAPLATIKPEGSA